MRQCTERIRVWIRPKDKELIEERMKEAGIKNMSAYIRKMAIDGYIIRLDLSEVKEVTRLLRINANNLNQVARVANGTGCINPNRIEELQQEFEKLCRIHKEVLEQLATIS